MKDQPKLSNSILRDPQGLARLIQRYTQTKHVSGGKHLHAQLIRCFRYASNYVYNHLLNMYSKCGRLDYARHLFDTMPDPNLVSWTALITAFSQHSLCSQALGAFSRMRSAGERPNEFAFSSLIQAATSHRDLCLGRQLHCLASKCGFVHDLFVSSNLADMYSKCGLIHDAFFVFEEMPYKDQVSWTSMIDGYAKHGHFREALLVFKRMLLQGLPVDCYLVSSALSAAASMRATCFGSCLHCIALKSGFEKETAVGNALVDMYSKLNHMDTAAKVFGDNAMNVVSYTSLIDGYVQADQSEKALSVFLHLRRQGMHPNEFTFSSLLKACANQAALDQGSQLHAQVMKLNFSADPVVSSALVYMYGKCGFVHLSERLFYSINNPTDFAWNSLMGGFSQNGRGKDAIEVFETMIQRHVKPNAITFINLIMGCSHAGLVGQGLDYFNCLQSTYGVAPAVEHYSCVIDLLSRAGKLQEAEHFIHRMPFEPNAFGWCSYLGACRIQGDKARAEIAAEKLMRLEPENSSAHVMLSSIYAQQRQWEHVRSLRRMMKDGNLKKLPGYSWVDVGNKTHVFGAHDWCHPQQTQIYEKLDSLIDKIKGMGYVPERDAIHIDADDSTKEQMLQYHSEKIAAAFAIMSVPSWKPIIIKKNLRICMDCHSAIKFMAKAAGRTIIVRDNSRFHHFAQGSCSCGDFW